MKKIGELHGMPVYENQHVPEGLLYILNGKQDVVRVDLRSTWRRFLDGIRSIIKRIVK